MKTEKQKINFLRRYGHFENEEYPELLNVTEKDFKKLKLKDKVVKLAIKSWQGTDINFDIFSQTTHGRDIDPDGLIGPVTDLMFETPRCHHKDYGENTGIKLLNEKELITSTGRGAYKNCHGANGWHRGIGRSTGSLPTHLSRQHDGKRVIDHVLDITRVGYGEIGMEWIFEWSPFSTRNHQADVQFGRWAGRWIGLAQVPSIGRLCSAPPLWARHQTSFRSGSSPGVVLIWWPILLMHELAHILGLGHTRGGIRNPTINNVPPRWVGDVSYNTMKSLFGGNPVPGWPFNQIPNFSIF